MHTNKSFTWKYSEEDYVDSVNLHKEIEARNITNKHFQKPTSTQ